MQILTLQDFAGAADQEFELSLGESATTLTLVEVKPLPAQIGVRSREPFSLLFRSGSPVILPQKSYRMRNPAVGDHDIFLVPVARDVQGMIYQAVFN